MSLLLNTPLNYNFEKLAVLPKDLLNGRSVKDSELTKIFGDMFEAYVAAIILSDPVNGVDTATTWLKQLWSKTLEDEIRRAEREREHEPRVVSMARNIVNIWRSRQDIKDNIEADFSIGEYSKTLKTPKEQLRILIGSKGVKIAYKDAAPESKSKDTKMPIFTVGCYLDGWGEKDKQIGFGRAPGKREAGEKAAQMALDNKKLMKGFVEKKKVFDKQMEAEKEALEKQEDQERKLQEAIAAAADGKVFGLSVVQN